MTEEKADQIIRCVKECWWQVLIVLGTGFGLAVLLFHGWFELNSMVASWVQALGSVGAILIAVYVLREQQKHFLEAEERRLVEAESRLLLSLHTEIDLRWAQYMDRLGSKIESGEIRNMGLIEWRTPENPFPVYSAACSDLGVIRDHSILALVIKTYAELESLLLTSHMLIDLIKEADSQYSEDLTEEDVDRLRAYILECYDQFEAHHKIAVKLVEEFLSTVRQYQSR